MTPDQQKLAIDLAVRKIALGDFVARTGIDPRVPGVAQRALTNALVSGDGYEVAAAMTLGYIAQFSGDCVGVLCGLLLAPWHAQHEDIAKVLQGLRDPRSVEALATAARIMHPHLPYDWDYPFARKCTWALADIGTPEARAQLEQLAAEDNADVTAFARKRLDQWENELPRKGTSRGAAK